jgi:acylphosphatase
LVEQRAIYFTGRVQGVGFRFTAQRIASNFSVSGYVQNLPDGRVLLMVQGEGREIERLLAAVAEKMGQNIHSVRSIPQAALEPLQGFAIRR